METFRANQKTLFRSLAHHHHNKNKTGKLNTTNLTETTYRTITAQFNSIITKTGKKHIPRGNRRVDNPNFTPEIKSLIETRENTKHSAPFPQTEETVRTVLSLNEQITTKLKLQQTQNCTNFANNLNHEDNSKKVFQIPSTPNFGKITKSNSHIPT